MEPTRRAIEPWFVKRPHDLRDQAILNALLQAAERVHRRAVAPPALGCIVGRHSLRRGATECGLGRLRQSAKRLKGHRVGALSKLRPNPDPALPVLIVQFFDLVAGLRVRQGKDGLEFLAEPVLLLLVESRPAGMVGEAKQVAWAGLTQHSRYALVKARCIAKAPPDFIPFAAAVK